MTRRRLTCAGAGALATVTLAGCGSDEDSPHRLDPLDELKQIRTGFADTKREGYWLGPSYRGLRLSRAELGGRTKHLLLSYGKRRCAPGSGCTWAVDVFTSRHRDVVTDPPICWSRQGAAWVLGCPGYAELEVLTGRDTVYIAKLSGARRLLAELRPLASRRPLQEPRPFSCTEQRRFPARFVRRLPAALASGCQAR